MARTDWAVAATTLVRLAARGDGRMRAAVLFRLALRWPSEFTHRPKARRYNWRYVYV
jgi:hypothetical protein